MMPDIPELGRLPYLSMTMSNKSNNADDDNDNDDDDDRNTGKAKARARAEAVKRWNERTIAGSVSSVPTSSVSRSISFKDPQLAYRQGGLGRSAIGVGVGRQQTLLRRINTGTSRSTIGDAMLDSVYDGISESTVGFDMSKVRVKVSRRWYGVVCAQGSHLYDHCAR
jgi:hypothetical protein